MVGKDRVAMLLCWHAKGIPQRHWHKGILYRLGRKDTFVHRKNDDIVKIQCTRLEHTHQLQAFEGFS